MPDGKMREIVKSAYAERCGKKVNSCPVQKTGIGKTTNEQGPNQ